jgi:hypothetical protein
MATEQRPKRQRQAKIFFDERETYNQPPPAKRTKKKQVQVLETIAVKDPPPEPVQTLLDRAIVEYSPPHRVPFISIRQLWPEKDPFSLFIKFLGEESITAIVVATNTYAAYLSRPRQQFAREWVLLTRGELLTWLGLLFYMGNHTMKRRHEYWSVSNSIIGEFMGQNRWEQIHRYLTFQPDFDAAYGSGSSFFNKIEPISSIIKASCRQAALPSSWLTVDESMVAFQGRSFHTVKIQGKPISEGYKVWVLSCRGGYIIDWLWHSRSDGPEGHRVDMNRQYSQPVPLLPIPLAKTYGVVIRLMERLIAHLPHQNWVLFLDNLFLTVDLAHVLIQMGVGVMGTTRKSHSSIPVELADIKSLNTAMVYGSILSVQTGYVLCFAWQDNNTALGITTAYSLHRPVEDYVVINKWRPKTTSTNYHIAKSVFGNEKRKALPIPIAIHDYNYGMNATDNSNQLRANLSSHQLYEHRTWRPLGYFLIDIAATNAYALWRLQQTPEFCAGHHEHEVFEQALISGLLHRGPAHLPVPKVGKRSRCRWGVVQPGGCLQEQRQYKDNERKARWRSRNTLGEISGNAARPVPVKRPRNIHSGCLDCNLNLCIDRDCFDNYHLYYFNKSI